jgi:hypothetical protein
LIASSVMRCAFQGQGQTCKQGRVLFTPLYCHVSYATNTYSTHACANIIFRRGKDKSSMPGYTLSMPLQREREREFICVGCVCANVRSYAQVLWLTCHVQFHKEKDKSKYACLPRHHGEEGHAPSFHHGPLLFEDGSNCPCYSRPTHRTLSFLTAAQTNP